MLSSRSLTNNIKIIGELGSPCFSRMFESKKSDRSHLNFAQHRIELYVELTVVVIVSARKQNG